MSLLLLQKRREMMKQFAWNTVTGIGRVVLKNGLNARLKALNLKGKTEQEKVEGKNLIDMCKIVDNEGYADSDFTRAVEINKFHVEEGKQYVLITKGSTNNFGSYSSVYFGENDLKYTVADTHVLDMNVGVKTIDQNKEIKTVVTAKKTCDITRCMIHGNAVVEKAYYVEKFGLFGYKDGSEEYEQYTGGKPSPNPEYPQEIISAGRRGKNLVDINDILNENGKVDSEPVAKNIKHFHVVEGKKYLLITQGTGASNINPSAISFGEDNLDYTTHDDNKTRVLGTDINYNAFIEGEEKRVILTAKKTCMITKYMIRGNNVVKDRYTVEKFGLFEIEGSNSDINYKPYSNKYMIDVKLTGKNLFDMEKASDLKNWIVKTYAYFELPTKTGKGYTLSFEADSRGKTIWIGIFKATEGAKDAVELMIWGTTANAVEKKTTFIAREHTYIGIFPVGNQSELQQRFTEIINDMQLEEGNVKTEYEPYKEQLVTITADRPLTKWDRIIKKDGVWGITYKHREINDFATLVKDNEEIYGNQGNRYFSVSVNDATLNYDYSKVYCEVGLYKKDVNILYVPKVMQKSFLIIVNDEDTIEKAKEHLHYKIIYETEEAEFVPFTEAEQIMINNLHTEKGTTYITANSGEVQTEIEATYKSNRRKNE